MGRRRGSPKPKVFWLVRDARGVFHALFQHEEDAVRLAYLNLTKVERIETPLSYRQKIKELIQERDLLLDKQKCNEAMGVSDPLPPSPGNQKSGV